MPINSRKKQRIRRRAQKQARREFNPQIRAAKQELRGVRKQRQRELQSATRAGAQLSNTLAQAMGAVRGSGLKGRYKQQTLRELSGMRGDAARMVPFEQRTIRQEYREPLTTARSSVAGLRVDKAEDAQKAYASRLGDIAEARAERQADANEMRRDRKKEVQLALSQAQNLLKLPIPDDASDAAKKAGHPVTEEEWAAFTEALAKKEGIGFAAAKRAVAKMRRGMLDPPVAGQITAGFGRALGEATRRMGR